MNLHNSIRNWVHSFQRIKNAKKIHAIRHSNLTFQTQIHLDNSEVFLLSLSHMSLLHRTQKKITNQFCMVIIGKIPRYSITAASLNLRFVLLNMQIRQTFHKLLKHWRMNQDFLSLYIVFTITRFNDDPRTNGAK